MQSRHLAKRRLKADGYAHAALQFAALLLRSLRVGCICCCKAVDTSIPLSCHAGVYFTVERAVSLLLMVLRLCSVRGPAATNLRVQHPTIQTLYATPTDTTATFCKPLKRSRQFQLANHAYFHLLNFSSLRTLSLSSVGERGVKQIGPSWASPRQEGGKFGPEVVWFSHLGCNIQSLALLLVYVHVYT